MYCRLSCTPVVLDETATADVVWVVGSKRLATEVVVAGVTGTRQ